MMLIGAFCQLVTMVSYENRKSISRSLLGAGIFLRWFPLSRNNGLTMRTIQPRSYSQQRSGDRGGIAPNVLYTIHTLLEVPRKPPIPNFILNNDDDSGAQPPLLVVMEAGTVLWLVCARAANLNPGHFRWMRFHRLTEICLELSWRE